MNCCCLLTMLSWQNCFKFPSAKVQFHHCFIIMFLLKSLLHLDGKAVKLRHSLNVEVSDLFRKLRRDGKHITHLKGYQDPQSLKMQTLTVGYVRVFWTWSHCVHRCIKSMKWSFWHLAVNMYMTAFMHAYCFLFI